MLIGKKAPDFTLDAYHNKKFTSVSLNSLKGKYTILIFYPLDFTFVCPTELVAFSKRENEFAKLNAQVLYISCDSKYAHEAWCLTDDRMKEIKWPMLSDLSRHMIASFDLLTDEGFAHRATIILDKELIVRHISVYNDKIGRNVDEIVRIVENMKYLDENKDVPFCPVDYKVNKK